MPAGHVSQLNDLRDNAGPSVLVLDRTAQTLAVVRALGRAGYRIIVGSSGGRAEVEWSRYCDETWLHPSIKDAASFGAALSRFLDERSDVGCVFPVGESSAAALCRLPNILAKHIDIAMVPPAIFEACHDKGRANLLAQQVGILVPETRTVGSLEEMHIFVRSFGFPAIVKPVRSTAKIFGRKAYILTSADEFQARFSVWPPEHDALLIQRYVEGRLEQCDFVAAKGVLVAYFQAHALRTDMVDGTGFAVDFLSDPIAKDVMSACRDFVRGHNYSGPGLMQLIRSVDDGKLYFIENNPRLSAGIAQSIFCGENFPLLTLQATSRLHKFALKEVTGDVQHYRAHSRAHWLLRDINGWCSTKGALSGSERRRWLRALFWSLVRADNHMTWEWRDPLPSAWIYLKLLHRLTLHSLERLRGWARRLRRDFIHLEITRPGGGAGLGVIGSPHARHHFARLYLGDRERYNMRWGLHRPGCTHIARRLTQRYGLSVISETRVSEELRNELIRMPKLIDVAVDLPSTLELYRASLGSSASNDLARIRSRRLTSEVTCDAAFIPEFYSRFHLPAITGRHGREGHVLPEKHLAKELRVEGTEFVKVMRDGACVAAAFTRICPEGYRTMRLGWRDGDMSLVKDGALAALYWFSVQRAYALGCTRLCLGGSPPYLDDGLMIYKAKWGGRLDPAGRWYGEWHIGLDPAHQDCQKFLRERSLVAFGADDKFVVFSGRAPKDLRYNRGLTDGVARWWRLLEKPSRQSPVDHPDVPAALRPWFVNEKL